MYYTEKRVERNIVNLLKVLSKLTITIRLIVLWDKENFVRFS